MVNLYYALLEEMIVANNGIINIDGKDIKAIDIVDSLNPELMERMVKLANGVEIPAMQYIQEVVAPHIPSNGKFILKSNNQEISAKQFIEEAVMFEGQEKYNGDINALLEAMTVANDGTVSIDMISKDGHKLELKQEDEALIGRIYTIINKIAKQEKIDDKGFRVIVNCGEDGGQEVKHLHFHLLGGRKLGTKICE